MVTRAALVVLAGGLLLATACASTANDRGSVKVVGTDTACSPERTDLEAGTTSFEFRNDAGDISELYVLQADGSVAGEVENVTTGSTKTVKAKLEAGTYRLVCKPGQKGDGFSATIQVAGGDNAGATSEPKPDRVVEVAATDYHYDVAKVEVTAGQSVRFELHNHGTVQHEMEVFRPDGTALGEIGPTDPDKSASVTLRLDEPGDYILNCGIGDHAARGMKIPFTVNA